MTSMRLPERSAETDFRVTLRSRATWVELRAEYAARELAVGAWNPRSVLMVRYQSGLRCCSPVGSPRQVTAGYSSTSTSLWCAGSPAAPGFSQERTSTGSFGRPDAFTADGQREALRFPPDMAREARAPREPVGARSVSPALIVPDPTRRHSSRRSSVGWRRLTILEATVLEKRVAMSTSPTARATPSTGTT